MRSASAAISRSRAGSSICAPAMSPQTRMPASRAARTVLDHQATPGRHVKLCGCVQEEIRRGLGVFDMLGGIDVRREIIPQSDLAQLALEARGRGGTGNRLNAANRAHGFHRTGHGREARVHRRGVAR